MITLEKLLDRYKNPAIYLVRVNGSVVGMLEKWRNTKTDTHPWKAFAGYGFDSKFVGAYYGRTGKQQAIDSITR